MKHIKLFERFPSNQLGSFQRKNLTHLKEDIEDIFIYFVDNESISIQLDTGRVSFPFNKVIYTSKEKNGIKYNAILNGDDIVNELLYSIGKLKFLDLKISYANIQWVNSGEWCQMPENEDKIGYGPGILGKRFTEIGLKDANIEVVQKGNYHTDLISKIIKEKGDRLRYILIYIDFI